MALEQGEVFAGYTVVRRLGAGGMGEVYLAQHPRLPRQDAIKVLPPHLASDEAFRLRFLREADLAAGLNHPNIVGVLDRGDDDGRLWLSMPYIDGVDAAERLRSSPHGLPLADVAAIISDTASALDYAHRRGVLHRDVKPANVLLDGSRALLSDFGIARAAGDTSDLTATGTTIGSVAYAAPEQLRGEPVGPAADIYSLAATTYALLTGLRPFDRSSPAAVVAAALEAQVPSALSARPDLPPTIDAVLARGMARAPHDRPATAGQFAAELSASAAGSGDPTMIRPASPDRRYDTTMIAPSPTPLPTPPAQSAAESTTPGGPRRRWVLPAVTAAAVLVGASVAGTVVLTRPDRSGTPAAATDSPTGTAVSPAAGVATTAAAPPTVTVQPTATVTASPVRPSSDLGLAKPVSTPACDGRYILVLVSIEESNPSLRALIGERLTAEPTAQYFYSGTLNCNSINSVDVNGERFYTPYIDYGTNVSAACYAVQHRNQTYVRTLRNGVAISTNPCG
ncbi:serine/threonine-protein kinase [Tsukamurella ocularis]|uniref:serine/threonine-protein kinase n=1 Tax=Tsukamurella ocularis TaxID=1970234 RepID=UPI0039EF31E0